MKHVFDNVNPPSPANLALRGGDGGIRGDLTDLVTGDEWGDRALESMRATMPNRRVGMFMNPEVLPRVENTVSLHPSKTDAHGNPVPDVSWNLGAYERKTMKRGHEIHRPILDEMGATIVEETGLSDVRPASHPMGTTRMGTDRTRASSTHTCGATTSGTCSWSPVASSSPVPPSTPRSRSPRWRSGRPTTSTGTSELAGAVTGSGSTGSPGYSAVSPGAPSRIHTKTATVSRHSSVTRIQV